MCRRNVAEKTKKVAASSIVCGQNSLWPNNICVKCKKTKCEIAAGRGGFHLKWYLIMGNCEMKNMKHKSPAHISIHLGGTCIIIVGQLICFGVWYFFFGGPKRRKVRGKMAKTIWIHFCHSAFSVYFFIAGYLPQGRINNKSKMWQVIPLR